jgi:hypothetical protein
MKLCKCGCGKLRPEKMWGRKREYIRGHHSRDQPRKKGEQASNWKGGRYIDPYGYVLIRASSHHRTHQNGYVFEHIIIMESYLGRELRQDEIVHHKNGVKDDNRIDNLELMTDSQHRIFNNINRILSDESRLKMSNSIKSLHDQGVYGRDPLTGRFVKAGFLT